MDLVPLRILALGQLSSLKFVCGRGRTATYHSTKSIWSSPFPRTVPTSGFKTLEEILDAKGDSYTVPTMSSISEDVPSKRPRTASENSVSSGRRRHNSKVHLCPPTRQGMTSLDKSQFDKNVSIPTIIIYEDQMHPEILRKVKPYLLKIQGIKPIQENEDEQEKNSSDENHGGRKTKKIFLNPDVLKGRNLLEFVSQELALEQQAICSVRQDVVKFNYDNWTWNQIFDSVLPDDNDKVSGFSSIGHILHLNLREHQLPFKMLIGQVFLDKISNAKTVVNKLNNIDNTYRNFQMEILAGDPNTVVHLKENRCEYEFDFKDVYWNSRLSSEHDRVVKIIQAGDILYDVFAGVGPFVIPAAKKKCLVLANDLNPESFKWLQRNVTKNKVHGLVKCYNQDGREFIQNTLSLDLLDRLKKSQNDSTTEEESPFDFSQNKIHIVMNLPAIAVEFLDSFWGILKDIPEEKVCPQLRVSVHVYCFVKDVEGFKEKALMLVEEHLKYKLPKENVLEVLMVRNVAPNKEMLRVSFTLPHEIMKKNVSDTNEWMRNKVTEIDSTLEALRKKPDFMKKEQTLASMNWSSSNNWSNNGKERRRAGLIIIGDEILKGQVVDTNSGFICKELYSMGVKVDRISVIGDGIEEIAKEVREFSSSFDIVITTGGIGPTHDDMTYVGVAKAFDETIALHPEMASMIEKWLGHRQLRREVILRMAEMPASAELIFDPNLPPQASFPIVAVRNVYVFPGVPQFVEKMFVRLREVLKCAGDNLFHSGVIYVNKDELSITHEINLVVDKFKDIVTLGSYPVFGNLYYSTRITMESHDPKNVQEAKTYLNGLLPSNSVVEYDSQPLETATDKVYEIFNNSDHELHQVVHQAVLTIEEALEKYTLENIYICFNGGKDCTALLHLFHAVVMKKFPNRSKKEKLNALCIQCDKPFKEMETFVQESSARYNLNLRSYNGPILAGLRLALCEHPEMKAVLMGTRRSDPSGKNLGFFQMTDSEWPQLMRISPMLEWKFVDVWKFIRSLTLPYCPLYDQGYTSIGSRDNTLPNPALSVVGADGRTSYRQAHTLHDSDQERSGRQ